jgi:hypothetical protein
LTPSLPRRFSFQSLESEPSDRNEHIAANPNTASATPGSGGGYFIIKNSWGAAYGDAGYLYMPVDYLKANATQVIVVSSFNKN